MKPAKKMLLVWLGLLLLAIAAFTVKAQEKPIKLSPAKVEQRKQQVAKAMQDRQNELLSKDPQFQQLYGVYQGLEMIKDTSLVADSVQVKKK